MKPARYRKHVGGGSREADLVPASGTDDWRAALTFEEEPMPADHPLRTLPNVVLTPHAAGWTCIAARHGPLRGRGGRVAASGSGH